MRRAVAIVCAAVGLTVAAVPVGRGAEAEADFSASGAQAILDRNCVKCHGPLEHKGGLLLDTLAAALQGNEDGPVITPGKPAASKLIAALSADADPHMPPKKQLTGEEIATLRSWIKTLKNPAMGAAGKNSGQALDLRKVPSEPSAAIDFILAADWKRRGVHPARLSDDATFVRRVYLDLAGRIPTAPEAAAFSRDTKPGKRARLVDLLLAGDDYPRNFREIWDALLLERHGGRRDEQRRNQGWHAFLEGAFRQNRPWNEVVRDMIVARPDNPAGRGSVWFLFERRNQHQQIAEALAPVIYGTRINCAQCHDHPLAREIKQAHYWGLVAAFNRSRNVDGGDPGVEESAIGGFVNFTNLKKESQPAVVALLNGKSIDEVRPAGDAPEEDRPEGYVDSSARVKIPLVSRRAELADAVTKDNPLLARSFVNYTWAILMGRGIVHPVDEMNSKHPPSHPELLEWLAGDFAAHHYDIRRLVRAVALSRAYQLEVAQGPRRPEPDSFAAALERPLTAEAIARSARIASGRTGEDETLRRAFIEAFPDVLPRVNRATIQQSMLLANNSAFAGLFKPDAGSAVERLGQLSKYEERVRQAFLLALTRPPDARELSEGTKYLRAAADRPGAAAGELLWALAAGPEFLSNH